MLAETERIAAALEPELRRIVDITMERVAAIEQQSMRGARAATAASEQASQAALERSSRLVGSVDTVTGTVGEMTSALRREVEQVTAALRGLHDLSVQLPDEPGDGGISARHEPPAAATPVAAARVERADPPPDQEVEPGPELTEMFRQHIMRMRDDGKSLEEAERVLKQMKHGRRFLGMLDDVYVSAPRAGATRRTRGLFARLRRGA